MANFYRITGQIRQAIEQTPSLSAEMSETIRSWLDQGVIYLLLLLELVRTCLFAMLGGVIGVAIFEKRKPGDPSHIQTSYKPPTNTPSVPPDAQ